MSEPDSNAEAEVPVTRWSRRAVDRSEALAPDADAGSADQFAALAERAARLAPPKTVSVRRIDEVFPEVDSAALETTELPKIPDAPMNGIDDRADGQTSDTEEIAEIAEAEEIAETEEIAEAEEAAEIAGDTGDLDDDLEAGTASDDPWPSFGAASTVSSTPVSPTPVLPTTSIDTSALEDAAAIGDAAIVADPPGLSEPVPLATSAVVTNEAPTLELRREAPAEPTPPESEALPPETPDFPAPTENLNLTVAPIQHAMLPAVAEPDPGRNRTGLALLVMATALAVLSGVLGALWLRERSASADLRTQLTEVTATDEVTEQGLESLNDEVRTLRLQNEQLQQQLNDMSALVLELPEGRVTEIAVPFTPLFADEENGRLIAIGESGEYITWGDGADGAITDSGSVSGTPTGLFAATRKAWVSTEAGRIDVLSLVAGEPGLPSVEFGPTMFMAAEERGFWTYNSASSEVVRLKKSDGGITDSVSVPVPIVDLTIGAGSVWALGDDGRVYRINTADLTVQPIDAGEDLIAVTAGPDALWTLSAADGSLRRVDPVTGEVLVTVPVGRDPIDATFAGSSVWVALRSGSSLIEVDTRTSAVVSRTTLPSEPSALHQGDSGVFVTTAGEVPLLRVASLTPVEPEPAEGDEADGS